MSNQELMDDIVKLVDPLLYDGRDCNHCLIGEVKNKSPRVRGFLERKYGTFDPEDCGTVTPVSEAYEVDLATVYGVYDAVAEAPYFNNLEAALDIARVILIEESAE